MKGNSWFRKPSNGQNNSRSTSFIRSSSSSQQSPNESSSFLQRVKSKLQQSLHSLLSSERLHNKAKCTLTLEQIRGERQEIFDKQIDQVLKPFLIKYFQGTINEMRSINGTDILPRNVYKYLSYHLLKHSLQRYKKKSSNANNSNKHYYAVMQQREIVLNETSGIYRKLFDGFDENRPYKKNELRPRRFLEPRQQVYWNIESLTVTTKFVFDFDCNKVFGINRRHKYRLISHHPHLIRYLIDAEDMQWFESQQLLQSDDGMSSVSSASASSSSSSRILLLVLDQILELPEKYSLYRRQCKNLDLSKLRSFTVPEFMLRKMRLFFIRLQIKSDGFITTVPPNNQIKKSPQLDNTVHLELSSNFDSLECTMHSTSNEHSTSFSTLSPTYDSDLGSTSSSNKNVFIYV